MEPRKARVAKGVALDAKIEDIYIRLQSERTDAAGGETAEEIRLRTGYSQTYISSMLRRLIAAGRAEYAGKRESVDVAGARKMVPVYRFIKPKGGKK